MDHKYGKKEKQALRAVKLLFKIKQYEDWTIKRRKGVGSEAVILLVRRHTSQFVCSINV